MTRFLTKQNLALACGALLLAGVFVAQFAYYFRSELVRYLPASAEPFETLEIPVPLPERSDLVTIEASDLQFDSGRGLFVLQATLNNRAAYAQAWPALELTLINTQDAVVARRIAGCERDDRRRALVFG